MKNLDTVYDNLPRYATLSTYPNNRSAHQLQRFKNGTGLCSCGGWSLEFASEASLIRTHQFHIVNTSN